MDQISGLDSPKNLEECLNSAQYNQIRSSGEIIITSNFCYSFYEIEINPKITIEINPKITYKVNFADYRNKPKIFLKSKILDYSRDFKTSLKWKTLEHPTIRQNISSKVIKMC